MKHDPTRRRLVVAGSLLGCALARPGAGFGQMPPAFDVVIRGGTIVDPARGMQARADLGIRAGRIAGLEPQLDGASSARTIDATGLYVSPALIDLHAQVYAKRSAMRAPADALAATGGITAWASAGDVGVDELGAFRDYSARHTRCRVYGFAGYDGRIAQRGIDAHERIARDLARHRETVLGLALHLNEPGESSQVPVLEHGLDVLRRSEVRGRILCHVGTPAEADQVLSRLRPGDILTHPFHNGANACFEGTRVRTSLLAARNRGVVIDVGHGGARFDPQRARIALDQGFVPDVISSGMSLTGAPELAQPRLVAVMSAFMNLGLTLDQVLAMTTVNPARIIGREPHLGTITLGAPADLALLKLSGRAGEDIGAPGALRLEAVLTLRSGVILPR